MSKTDKMSGPRQADADLAKRIARTCLDAWIARSSGLTCAALAKKLTVPVATIRRVTVANGGAAHGTSWTQVEIVKYSRSYPGMVVGHQMVDAWVPDDDAVRAEIRALRAALLGVEFLGVDFVNGRERCPCCAAMREEGHTAECAVGVALCRVPDEPVPET